MFDIPCIVYYMHIQHDDRDDTPPDIKKRKICGAYAGKTIWKKRTRSVVADGLLLLFFIVVGD